MLRRNFIVELAFVSSGMREGEDIKMSSAHPSISVQVCAGWVQTIQRNQNYNKTIMAIV
jgi:hypothetical protein